MRDDELPNYSEAEYLGDLGVRIVDEIVSDKLNMIFRRKEQKDIGIDAEIEIVSETRKGTGRLLALQIKCGNSFFEETNESGYIFRFSKAQYNYWSNFSIQVIIILCNPDTRVAYWESMTANSIIHLTKSCKITIPYNKVLSRESKYSIEELANRKQDSDIAELALFRLLHDKYIGRIKIAPIAEEPRDFQGLSYIVNIDEEIFMVGMHYDRYGKIIAEDLKKFKPLYEQNMRSMAWDIYHKEAKLLLFIISKSKAALELSNEVIEYIQSLKFIEMSRAVYSDFIIPSVTELDESNQEIYFY